MAIEERGECSFSGADDANIPVDIWLCNEDGAWKLTASNYMPRKGRIATEVYEATAPTREELAILVRERIVPLYRNALAALQAIGDGTLDHLYYWTPAPHPAPEPDRSEP